MKVIVVHNPKSGGALSQNELRAYFSKVHITVHAFIDVTTDFKKHVAKYTEQTAMPIVGYGGDGTLGSVASELISTSAIFAPLPGGTLNHFTKDLGINQDLQTAIARLPKAKIVPIDTASVNGKLFLNNSSIGLYPSSLAERSRVESKLGKWPAAVYASIRALVRFRLYTVTLSGKSYTTPFIFVGNNHYDIDSLMARTVLNKGMLSVHMITSRKRLSLFKIAFLSVFGRVKQANEFQSFETEQLEIVINRRRVRVSFDGEHATLNTPISYKIKKKSLNVLK
jgi:diacylglycerol kinase family enzyme